MNRACACILLFLTGASCIAAAQEMGVKRLPAGLPDAYVVKPGDTLWGISKELLGDPFSWQEIWKRNDFIRDPHWIYPGQTLTFGTSMGIEETPAPPAPPETPAAKAAPAETPVPRSAPEPVKAAAAVKALSAPADPNLIQFLSEPRQVFTEKNFMRTGFITKRSELSRKRVVGIEGNQVSAIRYDAVTVDMGSQDGIKEGDILAVFAVGDRVKHPDTGLDYGVVVRIKGVLRVASLGPKQSRCIVTETLDPLAVDDPVMRYGLKSGPLFDAWMKPDAALAGTIIAINEPMISIHTNDIIYLDRGARDGVRAGDHFTVYPRKPDENGYRGPLGEIEAVSVMPGETAVIVISLKGGMIAVGDRAELTARCRLVKK